MLLPSGFHICESSIWDSFELTQPLQGGTCEFSLYHLNTDIVQKLSIMVIVYSLCYCISRPWFNNLWVTMDSEDKHPGFSIYRLKFWNPHATACNTQTNICIFSAGQGASVRWLWKSKVWVGTIEVKKGISVVYLSSLNFSNDLFF